MMGHKVKVSKKGFETHHEHIYMPHDRFTVSIIIKAIGPILVVFSLWYLAYAANKGSSLSIPFILLCIGCILMVAEQVLRKWM